MQAPLNEGCKSQKVTTPWFSLEELIKGISPLVSGILEYFLIVKISKMFPILTFSHSELFR